MGIAAGKWSRQRDPLTLRNLLQALLAKMRGSIQLPECLRVIGYLRRLATFSEQVHAHHPLLHGGNAKCSELAHHIAGGDEPCCNLHVSSSTALRPLRWFPRQTLDRHRTSA